MNLLTIVTYEEGSWFRSGEEKCAHQSIYFSMFECFTKSTHVFLVQLQKSTVYFFKKKLKQQGIAGHTCLWVVHDRLLLQGPQHVCSTFLHVTHRITDVNTERGLRDLTRSLSSVKASLKMSHNRGLGWVIGYRYQGPHRMWEWEEALNSIYSSLYPGQIVKQPQPASART